MNGKLTPEQRCEIVCLFDPGVVTMGDLARAFRVNPSLVTRLVKKCGGSGARRPDRRIAESWVTRCANEHCRRGYQRRQRNQRFCSRQCKQATWQREKKHANGGQ